jgi:hypothetical protein
MYNIEWIYVLSTLIIPSSTADNRCLNVVVGQYCIDFSSRTTMRVGPLLNSVHHTRPDAFVPPAVYIVNINPNIPDKQYLFLSIFYCRYCIVHRNLADCRVSSSSPSYYVILSSLLPMKHDPIFSFLLLLLRCQY